MHYKNTQRERGDQMTAWIKEKGIRITTKVLFLGILCALTFQVIINEVYEQVTWRTRKGHLSLT